MEKNNQKYIKPVIEVIVIEIAQSILAASGTMDTESLDMPAENW